MTTGFDVDKLRFAQRQRLTFIESVAFWEGRVDRPRVSSAFNVSENHVTKDFRLYKDAFPGNLQYDETARAYRPTRKFKPRIGKGSAEEYLALLRAHLNPSGIVALNTTGSLDAYRTAARVFPHAVRYRSFVYMSDSPLVHRNDALAVLRACRVPGGLGGAAAAAFADTALAPGGLAWRLATEPLQSAQAHLRASPGGAEAGVITDLNLLPEYRHGDGGGLQDLLGGLGLAPGR